MKKVRWTEEEIQIVKENWLKLKTSELQDLLPNRTKRSIEHIAERTLYFDIRKPTTKRYKVNDNFFSIPNPINSYLAGFISADGCVDINDETFINRLTISQADRSVLELFACLLDYKGKIQTRKTKVSKNSLVKKECIISNIRISSKEIISDLYQNFNIIPNKTLVNKPPNLNEYLSLCFCIGIIDGDGSISLSSKGFLNISLVGTKDICEWVRRILGNFGTIRHKDGCHENIYQLVISHNESIKVISKLRSIKELVTIRFARKWDKILEWDKFHKRAQ